ELTVDRTEVEEVFEVPLAFLLDPANQQFVEREFYGGCAEMIEFHYDSHRIWGATAFIIE
ncbi:MAG: hypothetical protein GTN60_03460, partial [Pseudomonas stutzeri]|nr:hypothetical protein [Stutzerimonas stutzeri]NIM85881.1 hypothetical protein [Stutzerimonas stutzeri]NIO99723.1 hypothetical protein [Stutzerimonas stutzeri]NIQ22319.1 hypothetical protein [Stutzerimonas stutzeri]NIQ41783.1 hypothetical protein [Stutzerimonas stutzeri]